MCKNCTSCSYCGNLVGVHVSFNHFIMGSTTSSMNSPVYGEEADPLSIFLFGCSSGSYLVNYLNISYRIGTNILRAVSGRDISM